MIKRVMILGAGSSGRGQLGQLAHEAGWEIIFADRDLHLVQALQQSGRYTVRLCAATTERQVGVDNFRAYPVTDTATLVREGMDIPLLLTCLFSQNLPAIAPLVARLIGARCAAGVRRPLNVICCENMQKSSSFLKAQVVPLLTQAEVAYAEAHVGFPDCMISRVVPLATENLLELLAEDYNEWTVDQAGFVGPAVDLPAMELVANQEARLARKFFMHNGGHAVCGYWGFHRGHAFIHEAVADPVVVAHVTGVMQELARVVSSHYGFTYEAALQYGMELAPRAAVAALQDRILRVVRDPLRKLSRTERLVAPAVLALEDGSPCTELTLGIAAVLHYEHPDDPQAVEMRGRLNNMGVEQAVPDLLGLPAGHPLVARVVAAYHAWPG